MGAIPAIPLSEMRQYADEWRIHDEDQRDRLMRHVAMMDSAFISNMLERMREGDKQTKQ